MPTIMRQMNVIARCAASYKTEKLGIDGLCGHHHTFVHTICKNPGISQEAIAKHTFLNKSTVTRTLAHLEEHGFIIRKTDPNDKRAVCVFPTEQLIKIYPEVKELAKEWNMALTENIPENELEIFNSVLSRMYDRAVKLTCSEKGCGNEK